MTDISIRGPDGVTIAVSPSVVGIAGGGSPTKADKGLTPLSTSGDGSPTGLTITNNPTISSYVAVVANGLEYVVGDGVKTTAAYFSADGGTTAKFFGSIVAGDQLIWNGVIAGFDLLAVDRLNFDYDT